MINKTFEKAVIFNLKNEISYEEGGIVSKNVLKNRVGNVSLFAFDKGTSLSEHTAPFDALVNVIEGQAEIVIDKKPYILQEGEIIIMPADIPHAVNAPNSFKMLLTLLKG